MRVIQDLDKKVISSYSLAEVFMWTKFQVKIQKYGFAADVGLYRENSLEPVYLARNKLRARIIFTVYTLKKYVFSDTGQK
jgi:hypothetical protein